MSVFYLITAAIYFFVKSLTYLKLKVVTLSTLILIKYSYNALIFIFDFSLFSINEKIYPFTLSYISSILIYFYFIYKISKEINLLKELNIGCEYNVTLRYKPNFIIFKMHILVLKKQNFIMQLIIILFFFIKFNIFIKILLFKYIGTFLALPIIYAQTKLYCTLLNIYYTINSRFMTYLDFDLSLSHIEYTYIRYKCVSAFIFVIYSLELFSLFFY
jgi:hypothetical protein